MKAPEHERMQLLAVAIHRATDELKAPIDRIEVTPRRIRCWAGPQTVTLSYLYAQGGGFDSNGTFTAYPGSGNWEVEVVRNAVKNRPELIGRALASFLKGRGW